LHLKKALEMENWAAKLYGESSEAASNAEAKKVFSRMSKISLLHAEIISGQIERMQKNKKKQSISLEQTIIIAETGAKEESGMRDHYNELSLSVTDKELKNLLELLSKQESEHRKEILSLIEQLNKT